MTVQNAGLFYKLSSITTFTVSKPQSKRVNNRHINLKYIFRRQYVLINISNKHIKPKVTVKSYNINLVDICQEKIWYQKL